MYSESKFQPKNSTLVVLIIARISTVNQDVRSLQAQIDLCKKVVCDRYGDHPIQFIAIQSQGSGERLDRVELGQAEAHVEAGAIDLVIAEDLGRIMRRTRAIDFCELCEDHNTRLLAINDGIDTAEKKWRRNALFAAMKHEESNEDTSDRIKRQMDHNFANSGGCVNNVVWGLVKPSGCKSDAELTWGVKARKLIKAWFWKVERQGAGYMDLARFLREHGITDMNHKRIARLMHNPVLTGYRCRGMRRSRRLNRTGERRGVVAPENQVLRRSCPHLKIISVARFTRVNRLLAERNSKYKVGADGIDPRKGRPKRRTTWPGAHLICGVCGRYFHWGAHGMTDSLACAGVKQYCCWNTTSVNSKTAGKKLSDAILAEVMKLEGFDQEICRDVNEEADSAHANRTGAQREIQNKIENLQQQILRLTDSIAETANSKALQAALVRREEELTTLEGNLDALKRTPIHRIEILPLEVLKEKAFHAFSIVLSKPSEVPCLIKRLMPEVYLVPFRLCDGGDVVLRAVFDLHLASLIADPALHPGLDRRLTKRLIVNLYEKPQREAIRPFAVAAKGVNPSRSLKDIAREISVTDTAVQNAIALEKRRITLGLTDPYVVQHEPPPDYQGHMCHHPDYSFMALPGFVPIGPTL